MEPLPLSREPPPPPPKHHRGIGFSIEALMSSPAVPAAPTSLLCMWPATAEWMMRAALQPPHGFFPAAAPRCEPRSEPATGKLCNVPDERVVRWRRCSRMQKTVVFVTVARVNASL